MAADFDQTDLDIVAELSADGRQSFREIARRLGVSEGTVRGRVTRMQESGYIRIAAVGSPSALGIACNAMVLIRVKAQSIADAAEQLAALAHVRFVGITLGSSDIVVQTLHSSFDDLFRFVAEEIPRLVPDLISTETLQVARVLKSEWNWAEWFREGLATLPELSAEGRQTNSRAAETRAAGETPR